MSDELQEYLTALEDIDTRIHHLFEELKAADELDVTLKANVMQTLRQTRSELDPALLAFRQRRDAPSTSDDDSITLQWTPVGNPPRRLIITPSYDDKGYTRRTLEWDGTGWCPCERDAITDVAIRAPTASRRSVPTDPPRLETLRNQIRGTWHQPEPLALVFEATTGTEPVVVDIDGELRYREEDNTHWYPITDEELQSYLTQRGQPTLHPLSETPLSREHFTNSPSDTHRSGPR